MPDISVILVNYNTAHLLQECFASLMAASRGLDLQIIVVDNASRDNSVKFIETVFPFVELIASETNLGFGRANNLAARSVRSEYVLLLNTDAFVAPDALHASLQYLKLHPDVGVVGGRLVGRDHVLQPSCRYFPTLLNQFAVRSGLGRYFPSLRLVDDMSWDHGEVRACDWVPGCFYLTRKSVIDAVGLFDARFFLYLEEVDHCRAVRQGGWRVVFLPSASVVHIGGESAKSDAKLGTVGRQIDALQVESELLYFRKWSGLPGALAHVVLSLLALLMCMFKDVLRPRHFGRLRSHMAAMQRFVRLTIITSVGARPTR